MNSRDLIVIGVTLILLLSIGIYALSNSGSGSEATILNMTSDSVLNAGDSITLKLTDINETPIPNQRIELNLTDDNGITENFTFKTNSKGECRLEDLISGNFSIVAKYYGNKDYKESSIRGQITVNKKESNNKNNASNAANDKYKSDFKVDDVINGWDPSEHEVSREDLGDGTTRINYDDGYFRIVDEDGNIITYGY